MNNSPAITNYIYYLKRLMNVISDTNQNATLKNMNEMFLQIATRVYLNNT